MIGAFASWAEFAAMGSYGAFVWGSFGIAATVLAGVWLQSARALKQAEAALAELDDRARNRP
ncbi:MAG: heme exporter protein CcmD [Alphaproteobacteria bacterium]|nr:heme exporter protein CcmD [Alphaproteobacteria bacterium]